MTLIWCLLQSINIYKNSQLTIEFPKVLLRAIGVDDAADLGELHSQDKAYGLVGIMTQVKPQAKSKGGGGGAPAAAAAAAGAGDGEAAGKTGDQSKSGDGKDKEK